MDAKEKSEAPGLRVEETIADDKTMTPPADPLIGQTIDGRYEVVKLLGAGGMGKVYQVKQLMLDRMFAMKLLSQADFNKDDVARFTEEARTVSRLQHPNLVSLIDHAVHDGAPYLVMEFVEGEPLSEMLKRGPLAQSDAMDIFVQLCSALGYAHSKGVIHRDIKPSNIIIEREANEKSRARIVDFGIAKSVAPDAAKLTQTGMVLGTPGYMSPEQCAGTTLDSRSDIYSVGCLMFETLTGRAPFVGDNNMQVIFKHINEQPPLFKAVAPAGVHIKPELERIVMQTLEKNPDNRYQNCEDLGKDLTLVAAGRNPVKEAARTDEWRGALFILPKLAALLCCCFLHSVWSAISGKRINTRTALSGKRLPIRGSEKCGAAKLTGRLPKFY